MFGYRRCIALFSALWILNGVAFASDDEVEEIGRLIIEVQKYTPFFVEDRTMPAGGVPVLINGQVKGFTNSQGVWRSELAAGHYMVRSAGIRNRASFRSVTVIKGAEQYVQIHHHRRLLGTIIIERPWRFGLF